MNYNPTIMEDKLTEMDVVTTKTQESYKIIKRILAMGFMDYLDQNAKQGKMCLSNMECEDIDDAFDKQDWDKLARYAQKYLK